MSKKILENLLDYANYNQARRLVLSPGQNRLDLEYHFEDGSKKKLNLPTVVSQDFLHSLYQIMGLNQGDLVAKKYHKIQHRGAWLPLYISVLPNKNGEKILIELTSLSSNFWRLNQLGMTATDRKKVRVALNKKIGLIIVSSPPRQGRSTTLRALAAEIDADRFNTYFLGTKTAGPQKINQLNNTPSNWLKLRQHDSDIIFADADSNWLLSEALLTAATGRLIVITLEAATSREVAQRIKALKLPPSLISGSLKMIINEQLIAWPSTVATRQLKRNLIGRFEVIKF